MKRYLVLGLLSLALALPVGASAFFPFGGRVVSPPIKCDVGVLFFVKGFPYSGPMMWLPGTKPNLVSMGAPPVMTQCILGNYIPGFVPCTIAGAPAGGGPTIAQIPGFGTSAPGCFF